MNSAAFVAKNLHIRTTCTCTMDMYCLTGELLVLIRRPALVRTHHLWITSQEIYSLSNGDGTTTTLSTTASHVFNITPFLGSGLFVDIPCCSYLICHATITRILQCYVCVVYLLYYLLYIYVLHCIFCGTISSVMLLLHAYYSSVYVLYMIQCVYVLYIRCHALYNFCLFYKLFIYLHVL